MNPEKQALSAWADQGMLLWAAHKTQATSAIQQDLSWNFPSLRNARLIARAVRNGRSILDEIRSDHPNAKIVHWLGKNKLSNQLAAELQELFVQGFGK